MRIQHFTIALAMASISCQSQNFSSPAQSEQVEQHEIQGTRSNDSNKLEETISQDSGIVNEPVSVAGAFLSCQYSANQLQNEELFELGCQLANVSDPANGEVVAAFNKVDDAGNLHPLQIIDFDSSSWQWTLLEPATSVSFVRLMVEIRIDITGPYLFSTDLDQPVPVNLFLGYWLASEPNNMTGDENCVEILNRQGQINHMNASGMTSGDLERLNDVPCNINRRFLCRSTSPELAKWQVSAQAMPFANYPNACPAGYRLGLALSDEEIMEVSAVIDPIQNSNAFWVAMRRKPDQQNQFELIVH